MTGGILELQDGSRARRGRALWAAVLAATAILALSASPALSAPLPIVNTEGSKVGAADWLRVLEGTVVPGDFKLNECHFEFGVTTGYGESRPCIPGPNEIGKGTTPKAVSAETEPLDPATTYHYRLVATNGIGTVLGGDREFTTPPIPDEGCLNEQRRREQGIAALLLPDCMALEMVSPPVKSGNPASRPNVSADGSRVSFISAAALGEDPPGALTFGGVLYVAGRGGSGWNSEITEPDLEPRLGAMWGFHSAWRPSFTPDFSRWLGIGGTEQQIRRGIGEAYEAGLSGYFRRLSEPQEPVSFSGVLRNVVDLSAFQAASADHSHFYFRPGANGTYLPGDSSLQGPGAEVVNAYLAREGSDGELAFELLQRDREGKAWGGNCGARLGGIGPWGSSAPNGLRNQGAVSPDGSRTYLSARAGQPQDGSCDDANKLRILERLETPTGPQVVPLFASECSRPSLPDPPGPCSPLDGSDLYQGASLDQTKVYFTTNRQLADSDLDGSAEECSSTAAIAGCDLYLYDRARPAGERLVQVSAGEDVPGEHDAGEEAGVFNGVTAISADGSHVYFVATGALTASPNPEGDTAQVGQPNLYLWNASSEEVAFLGALDPADGIENANEAGRGLWGAGASWRNDAYPVPTSGEDEEVGGDGHLLVFQSLAELTENDADSGHLDVYRYDAGAGTLICVSCAPGSSPADPDEAPFDVDHRGPLEEATPPGTDFAESGRWVSEDGKAVGLFTAESYLPGDLNGTRDGYLWRDGELTRLPGLPFGAGEAPTELIGPFLSHDGSTVAFASSTQLLPQDGDKTGDVYVARAGGGFANPPSPKVCVPGDPGKPCQEPPQPPPAAPQAGSEAAGQGNPPGRRPCPKGKVRRKGRCVKKHSAKRGNRARNANANRRAGK
jgi:hypothetical protein